MSLRAVWEIYINLDRFKNIAIRKNCVCLMHLKLYYEYEGKIVYAKPLEIKDKSLM